MYGHASTQNAACVAPKRSKQAMGTYITVVLGPKKRKGAKIENSGLKFRGRLYYPAAVHPLQGNTSSGGSILGGAIAGELLAGPVGALIGASVAGKGQTSFVIETSGGERFVCLCSARQFPGVYAQLDQLIHPSQMVTYATRPPFSWTKAVIGGPL
jgi:hypothetical protein